MKGAVALKETGQPTSFSPAIQAQLQHAEQLCTARGEKLTAVRRQVLGLVLASLRPVGAYDLLERLRHSRTNAVPPTIYRALDFLRAQGFIHKIERLSAFVACHDMVHQGEGALLNGAQAHDPQGWHHADQAQFLICRHCGEARELRHETFRTIMEETAHQEGFEPETAVVEITGRCKQCRQCQEHGQEN
ncbi:transcriptional repressor [Formicincola oecophyllae]|uniref:Transcriptional repressor n=1 Tax=Formicincola oecophyllae TaxID=2558361 RepID=A0A4Y6U8F7_9PROT|nr:Fur family transcriptional regulator [Formicincola oecophyllae]QDH13652.1 transcriptional repressor [Formicincola oecophyllae]